MTLQIRPIESRRDLLDFVKIPWTIYSADPAWVPPLIQERLDFLNPKKNPYFRHAEVQLFLAIRKGRAVGRISAQIDQLHNQIHGEKTGFFGFFESLNDPEIATSLLQAVETWHRKRGMTKSRGPFNFSINDECGLLVEGFEHSPFVLTGHNPSFYPPLVEAAGYQKVKDLYCWYFDGTKPVPEEPQRIADAVRQYPGLTIRPLDRHHLGRDVRILIDVFNSAWSQNWGFVPLTDEEIAKSVKDLRPILEPSMILIAEVEGKPAGICLCLPNVHQFLRDLKGRLFPIGWLKLLYRLKLKQPEGFRLLLLGVKKEYRGSVLGGLSVLFYVEIHKQGRRLGLKDCELSWTLEDNEKINAGIQFMGGEHYKTYRLYEKLM